MFIHPSIHLEIVRQRQQDVLARSGRRPLARAALAGGPEARDRSPEEPRPVHEPSPTMTASRPQRVNP